MQLAAVGGEKQIAAAIRLAGYKYDEIESVKTLDNASFNIGAAGDLPEQSGSITERAFLLKSMNGEAVLNLFADAHWATLWIPLLLRVITVIYMRCTCISMQRPRCSIRNRLLMLIIFHGHSVFLIISSIGLCIKCLWDIRQSLSTLMEPIPISETPLVSGLQTILNVSIGICTQTSIRFTDRIMPDKISTEPIYVALN